MRILLASSEVHPYSKTGGLADMVGALGKHLARQGHRVGLVTPLYTGIREKFPQLKQLDFSLKLPLGSHQVVGQIWTLEPAENLTIYFVDQPEFYLRPALYQQDGVDFPDNAERFLFLSKAVVQLARRLPWKPELVHVHDWQVGMVPLLIHQEKSSGWTRAPRTCATIHNLAYQGVFPVSQYVLTNLPGQYFRPEGVEFYGKFNCLKAAIVYSDLITTVSPRYAREITTVEYGCGLDGLLRKYQSKLVGILNGVDYDEWNTTRNPFIHAPYSIDDLAGKMQNKLALQAECGLPVSETIPLFGSVNRLVEQKGVDIQLGALEEMLGANIQFVLLGSGNPVFEQAYQDLARRHPDKVAVRIGYNHGLSHRIEAGCDFFLLPSRFEPCGLNQMYSLRYGTIPIVRATGGLDDTVVDLTEDADRADGIKFSEYSSSALARCIRKALAIYGEPELFEHYRLNGMAADFSWERTAQQYLAIYQRPSEVPVFP
ncbi:MAG TPA: glycogen synthase GlgA [Verrucomicrobiae bacterium]|nr:glycogen synthase GlgA [Verrucomicrobiae bacterium]